MKKLRLYITFYKSTLKISLPLSLLFALLLMNRSDSFSILIYLENLLLMYATAGLTLDFMYKELARKEEYIFYYNGGISKTRLIGVTYGVSILAYLLIF